jgi:hypothetical protein
MKKVPVMKLQNGKWTTEGETVSEDKLRDLNKSINKEISKGIADGKYRLVSYDR